VGAPRRLCVREVVIFKVVGDGGGGGAEAERDVGRGDALGGDEDVGLDVPVVDGEPLAGAAQPAMTSSAIMRTP